MVRIFCIHYSPSCHFLNNVGTLDASVMSKEWFSNVLLKYAFHLPSDHTVNFLLWVLQTWETLSSSCKKELQDTAGGSFGKDRGWMWVDGWVGIIQRRNFVRIGGQIYKPQTGLYVRSGFDYSCCRLTGLCFSISESVQMGQLFRPEIKIVWFSRYIKNPPVCFWFKLAG